LGNARPVVPLYPNVLTANLHAYLREVDHASTKQKEILMAHLLEQMAYIDDTPWHGLGNQLSAHEPIEVWARQAGMDWQIREAPVRFMTDIAGSMGAIESFPENKVLFRSDTNSPLSVVSQRYKVVQPSEILEFYRDLTEVSGFELETAGILKGGRKIWALARTGQSSTLKGNDVTNAYVLLATACDGTLATTAQFTSIRVVCNNTLAVALAGSTGAVKVPHNTSFDPQSVKRQLGISVATWDSFMYRMKGLSERKVMSNEAANYVHRVFSNLGKTDSQNTNERAMAKVMTLFDGHGKGADLASSKGTAFGLMNAVTQFVDHERRARSPDHRLESAWFGPGALLKEKALEQALMMMS
jgi:phage/plasmid-like protein (TIGR03299 family)